MELSPPAEDAVSKQVVAGIDLETLPVDTTPLHQLDEDRLRDLFERAQTVATSAFFWACACIDEYRRRYAKYGDRWYRIVAEKIGRHWRTVYRCSEIWRLYQDMRGDPVLSSHIESFTSLSRGTLMQLEEVSKRKRRQATELVLRVTAERGEMSKVDLKQLLRKNKLIPPVRSRQPLFGPPLNFRELRHEPTNELGVVYLFGMVAAELGFLVEGIARGYPDCDAKRLVKGGLYEPTRIEFEFKSSDFERHGHDPSRCDVIVCWEDDWPDCPVEVIDLKSRIRQLDLRT